MTYSFPWTSFYYAYWQQPVYNPPYNEPEATKHFGFNTMQMKSVKDALQAWSNVANVNFTQVYETTTEVGDFRFAFSSALPDTAWGWSQYPNSANASAADVWVNPEFNNDPNWLIGSTHFENLLHEIGHGLGLKHPGNYGGSPAPYLSSALDFRNYTLMSYNEPVRGFYWDASKGSSAWVFRETPMVYDIQAIQYLYGANNSYHTGDDVYKFDPSTPFYKTIWDAGGVDTIDISNYSLDSIISLIPGSYSKVSFYSQPPGDTQAWYDGTNALGIAFGAAIENANGGFGSDILTGNNADNALNGGDGSDQLYGGLGNDTFDWESNLRGGNDTMYGGLGDDTYVADSLDTVIEYSGEGVDTVWASESFIIGSFSYVENLYLFGDKSINATGNEVANGLKGNDQDNILVGNAGDDDLDGGAGNDQLYGGTGNDILRAGYNHDTLNGSTGNDTFGFYALGHFQVSDFTVGEDRLFFDSSKIGVNNLHDLVGHITNINQKIDGVTVEFGSDASIELVGINLNQITADMVVFTL